MRGVISSGHPVTSEAGASVLRKGGTAVDAALAASAVSGVTEPGLTSLGGGGLAVIHEGDSGRNRVFDFFADMPGLEGDGPDPSSFKELVVDYEGALETYLVGMGTAALPGVLPGILYIHEEMGTLPLADVLAPAIRVARDGVVLSAFQARCNYLFRDLLGMGLESRKVFFRDGVMLKEGELFTNPNVARLLSKFGSGDWRQTLENEFYSPIVKHMEEISGPITPADLEHYTPIERCPLEISCMGFDLLTPPPPSTGGLRIAFLLKLLERNELAGMDRTGPEYVELLAQCQASTDAMRKGVVDGNIHDKNLAEEVLSEGCLDRFTDDAMVVAPPRSAGNTTQISVTDATGTAVSLTTTTGESTGFMIPGTGVLYNNMLGEIDLNPDGCRANPVGKRLTSSMSPSVMLADGEVIGVMGSGGSSRIISAIVQVSLNHAVFGLDAATSVESPRAHYEGGVLQMEAGFPAATVQKLKRTFEVNEWDRIDRYFGGVHMTTGRTGAGDTRRSGHFMAVE
ncbi:MAG: gamma-glutamyltransferase [Candidatus Undinarchaeales archaeon]|jgi:gamma-glutamyltranspeptidase/glutathione hydrolase|nr:gamma-glutamyltransferase [Candidatus Undinarchaeales archaeon]MDP7492994.1 gamma-glutamyltransferase [Candidatus Undinarchaeales archaeon]